MLECCVCYKECEKLKKLPCSHSFCVPCLGHLQSEGTIKCPMCRADCLLPPLGIRDLETLFAGLIDCRDCKKRDDLNDSFWCSDCVSSVCGNCKDSHPHKEKLLDRGHAGILRFSTRQLENFCQLHINLCEIQKQFVTEYTRRLEDNLHKRLDADVLARIRRFKEQKQYLERSFDMPYRDDGDSVDSVLAAPSNNATGAGHIKSTQLLAALGCLDACTPEESKNPELLNNQELFPKDGFMFAPPNIGHLTESMLKRDKFTSVSCAERVLPPKSKSRTVSAFLGAGILNHPCDLCPLPHCDVLLVTSTNSGLYRMRLSDGVLTGRVVPESNSQLVGIDYCERSHRAYITSLDDFRVWTLRVYKGFRCDEQIKAIPIPCTPTITNSWYRWVTVLDRKHVLISGGDKTVSALWLCNIETEEFTLISQEENCTYRRASVKTTLDEYMVFVPDMQNSVVKMFSLKFATYTLKSFADMSYDELTNDMPVGLDINNEMLAVGYWRSGNLVVADMNKSVSWTVATVGPGELLSIRMTEGNKVYALCKQKEMILVYRF